MEVANVVFVLGLPGSGKGTQCELLAKEFGYIHLSAGEILRTERKRAGSDLAEVIDKHFVEGTIVPVEITCLLLKQAMSYSIEHQGKCEFLIDGFPVNHDNLKGWEEKMENSVNLKFVLFFDIDEETCMRRCVERGKAGSGRCDDNRETLKRRIVTYNRCTRPIIEYYEEKGLVRKINACRPVPVVFEETAQYFRS